MGLIFILFLRRYRNNINKPSTATCGTILLLFQAGKQRDGNAASPPLSVGDSRYSAAEPKGRRPSDTVLPNMLKSIKRACNLRGIQGRVSLEYLGYLPLYTNSMYDVSLGYELSMPVDRPLGPVHWHRFSYLLHFFWGTMFVCTPYFMLFLSTKNFIAGQMKNILGGSN